MQGGGRGGCHDSPRPAGPGMKERVKFHLQRQHMVGKGGSGGVSGGGALGSNGSHGMHSGHAVHAAAWLE